MIAVRLRSIYEPVLKDEKGQIWTVPSWLCGARVVVNK